MEFPMKINLSLADVKTAINFYLKNELGLTQELTNASITFKNARSYEDMSFEIDLAPKHKKEFITDLVKKEKEKDDSIETPSKENTDEPKSEVSNKTEEGETETEEIIEPSEPEGEQPKEPNTVADEYQSIFGNL